MDRFPKGKAVRFIVPFGIDYIAEPGTFLSGEVINTYKDFVWIRHEDNDGYSSGVFEVHVSYVEPGKWITPPVEPVWVPE